MKSDFDILGQLEASFNTKRISIIEFAESPKYCNRILYPRQKLLLKIFFLEDLTDEEERILDYWIAGGASGTEMEISPFIRERIAWLKENGYRHFREIVLVGGRRCSKGFLTGLSMAKLVYDTLQLQDPGRFYGIDQDKEIVFAAIAAAQDQAKDQQYADFASMVNSCKAMDRYVTKLQELEFSVATETDLRQVEAWKRQGRKILRDTSTIRGKALPANSRTIRGSAMMGIVFDEFAHFMQGESDQADSEVYAAAEPSLDQFKQDAMLFCNSSPFSKVGTLYERYEAGMETENAGPAAPNVLTLRFPSWALFEGWWEDPLYMARGHHACIQVSPDWDINRVKEDDSLFYNPEDRQAIMQQRMRERDDPGKYKVERRGQFAEVIDAYLIPERVDQMFAGIPKGEGGYVPLYTNTLEGTYEHSYRAHLDPSSTTAGFGFALAHTEVLTVNGVENHHVVFDIVKRWNPKDFPENVIEWEPILQELMFYIDVFRPDITMDQFNSAYPLQWLRREVRKQRLNDVHIFEKTANSQANWNCAEVFRTALYQGLVHAPYDNEDCQWAGQELKFLQEIKTGKIPRIEKQEAGPVQTKDIADCMMIVVEALIGNIISQAIRKEMAQSPAAGAYRGYPIGGPDHGGHGKGHPLSEYYSHRQGEQRIGIGADRDRRQGSNNPTRRPFGGRPIPRKLPGW